MTVTFGKQMFKTEQFLKNSKYKRVQEQKNDCDLRDATMVKIS